MILVGIGANLPHPRHGPPRATCAAAVDAMAAAGLRVVRRSRWYRSAPVPPSAQPWFVNGVVEIATSLEPEPLLALLHRIEADFGRRRGAPGAARILDLDLLAYGDRVSGPGAPVHLPHPRLHERAFVLRPLLDVAPQWRHPMLSRTAAELAAALPADQMAEPLHEGSSS